MSDLHVLGLFDFASYRSSAFHLCQGDILIVYSDGLTDARDQQDEMFGDKTLRSLIRRDAPAGESRAGAEFVERAIEEFTQGRPRTDDITFIVVEKLPGT